MVDRPILFSAPMVRGLLDGRKTQTRRALRLGNLLEPIPDVWGAVQIAGVWHFASDNPECGGRVRAPVRFADGDRLWVRETWRTTATFDDAKPRYVPSNALVSYDADYDQEPNDGCRGRTRVAIHMPRWVSRLTLTITNVRVQRLQEISATDTIAEGVECVTCEAMKRSACDRRGCFASRQLFQNLWTDINGTGAWDTNPWVVALTFTVKRLNIDASEISQAKHGRTMTAMAPRVADVRAREKFQGE